MPYKRPESSYWQVRRKSLPGYGDTGAITSKSKKKRVAERMERLLEELAERALLDPVVDRRVDLPTLLRANAQRRLPALLQSLHDPLLAEAVKRFREHGDPDRQTKYGLDKLLELTPTKARLSHLQSASRVTALCRRCEKMYKLKRNTVDRQFKRAISLLLREEVGSHERDRIFADVQYERIDDTREVHLSPAEFARLLDACDGFGYDELRTIILAAVLTSADRGVLLAGETANGKARGLLKRDLAIYEEDGVYSGKVHLVDGKADGRKRTVPFGDRLARELLVCADGKGPDEPVFDMRYPGLDYRWQRVREKAGLEHVRFKDLRAQTAIYAQRAGVPQAVAQAVMGHRSEHMTRRYQQHQAAMTAAQAEALEAAIMNAPNAG